MPDTQTAIREAMTARGISQTALGAHLGLTQPAISARLSGRTPITVDELRAIADLLDVSASTLLDGAA